MSSIDPEDDFDPEDRLTSSRSDFDWIPQEALRQSMRHPLEYERERSLRLSGIAGFAAGICISAIIAFVFFILVPKLSQSTLPQPAVSEFTSTIAPPGGDKTTPEESEALLGKFIQWQQKK